jgi:hypothetical protein
VAVGREARRPHDPAPERDPPENAISGAVAAFASARSARGDRRLQQSETERQSPADSKRWAGSFSTHRRIIGESAASRCGAPAAARAARRLRIADIVSTGVSRRNARWPVNHLEEHAPEREDVGRGPVGRPAHLLGRHVADRFAHDRAHLGCASCRA